MLTTSAIVGCNTKFDLKCLLAHGVALPSNIFFRDISVDTHLVRSDLPSYHLADLAKLWNFPFSNWKHLVDFDGPYWEDSHTLKFYNRCDLAATQWVSDRVQPLIEKYGLTKLQNLMSDCIRVMAHVELEGIQVSEQAHQQFTQREILKLDTLRIQLKEFADIDWQSPPQVGDYYKKLKIKLPKTAKGNKSVNEHSLLKIEHPSAKILLDYRAAAKQAQTYGKGFANTLIDWKYYPDYKLAGSSDGEGKAPKTGRMSEKFIQVMPRKNTSDFKKCIVSKYPGGFLVTVDWQQLEVRLNAELAYYVTGKRHLLDDLINGVDLHAETLRRFPRLPDRTRAKNVNFSVFFGGKGYTLCNEYGLTSEEAEAIRKDLIEVRYPEMQGYFDSCEAQIIRRGMVACPYTGKRRFTSSFTEAYNDKVQHLGSVFNKIMMSKGWDALKNARLVTRPICEIHDEIIYDVPQEELGVVLGIIRHEYAQFPHYFHEYFGKELQCSFNLDIKVGKNLMEVLPV